MGKPSAPPPPPSPAETADAQTGSNVNTAISNKYLNNTNQITPFGNLTYTQTGTKTVDGRSIPTFTSTYELAPEVQQWFDTWLEGQQKTQGLIGDAQDAVANRGGLDLSNVGPGADYSKLRPDDVTRTYGDASADLGRQRVEDALFDRLDRRIKGSQEDLDVRLARQGITLGSEAHRAAQDAETRAAHDARISAILGAGTEHSRLLGEARAKAGFENAAAAQKFGQGITLGNAYEAKRNARIQEEIAKHRIPIETLASLRGGAATPTIPQFLPTNPTTVAGTDVAGITNAHTNALTNRYNSEVNMYNQGLGGLLGLFSAFI